MFFLKICIFITQLCIMPLNYTLIEYFTINKRISQYVNTLLINMSQKQPMITPYAIQKLNATEARKMRLNSIEKAIAQRIQSIESDQLSVVNNPKLQTDHLEALLLEALRLMCLLKNLLTVRASL
ncbi:hypothetical protein RclHR1_00810016 [Rhizophagus clarus]|uniref:Uncharacterized protein n=2 Tax=Rhizophagus clarus TaxID=94130 RepID=A0A2Z6RZX1_9GLOM|nr:hypothetical protein RclHR1_00810016 [Rhizophagus clarus]